MNESSSETPSFSLTAAMSTEEGVYGLILVSGLIATSGSTGSSALRALIFTGITVVVFWAAHVYAGTVAAHGTHDTHGEVISVRPALRRSIRRARGMLAATLFPALALLLGVVGLVGDRASLWLALWVGAGVLGVLGFVAYQRKGAPLHMRVVGAVSTASFGVAIIVAKAVITH